MLPALKYDYAALEPYIDAKTVEIHYSLHHKAYLDKLNVALESHPEIIDQPVLSLLRNLQSLPSDIQTAVKNNGGGYYNHSLYWNTMTANASKSEELEKMIISAWSSTEAFKAEFIDKATTLFGSGWVWLVEAPGGSLKIIQTPNQDVPDGKHIMAIDIWEHAYYLKYQNRRADYIAAWWNIIDWKEAYKNFTGENQY